MKYIFLNELEVLLGCYIYDNDRDKISPVLTLCHSTSSKKVWQVFLPILYLKIFHFVSCNGPLDSITFPLIWFPSVSQYLILRCTNFLTLQIKINSWTHLILYGSLYRFVMKTHTDDPTKVSSNHSLNVTYPF